MGARLDGEVSAGTAGKKGAALNALSTEVKVAAAYKEMLANHEGIDFSAVRGNQKGGSQSAAAPDNGGAGPSFEAQAAHRGMMDIGMGQGMLGLTGNSPQRPKGHKTTAADAEKLSTAGA